jgi:hypothetical protein
MDYSIEFPTLPKSPVRAQVRIRNTRMQNASLAQPRLLGTLEQHHPLGLTISAPDRRLPGLFVWNEQGASLWPIYNMEKQK